MTRLEELKTIYRAGRIDRRQFMEGALALGMTLASASTFASKAHAAAPKKGGHARFGVSRGSTGDSLDPIATVGGFTIVMQYALRGHLTEVGNDGLLRGDLAESFEASPDAKTWRFKLRKGVEFHNGKTMEVEDVIASFNYHRGEDTKSPAKSVLEAVETIKADGKDTVVFELSSGSADFPYSVSDYHLCILPAKDGGVDWESGVGTGGYKLETFEPGVRATMRRNPNYWKPDAGNFDEAEILSISDGAARVNALISGEIDAIDQVDLKVVDRLEQKEGIRVEQTTGNLHCSIPMNTTVAPFDNNDVRLALKYAIDREAIVKSVLKGYGEVGNDHSIGPANQFLNTDLPQRRYDPDKAKFHLKQAGMSSLKVDLSTSDGAVFSGAVATAELYKEHAAKAGIDINLVREPADGYWSNVWMVKPWSFSVWSGRPTEDWMFTVGYAKGGSWNETFWDHERFNKLLVEARAELDQEKRRTIYYEMQQILSDEGGAVVPMFMSNVHATSDRIAHGPMAANWEMDGSKCVERWWFA